MAVDLENGAESRKKRRRKTTGSLSEDCHIPISARLYKRIANTLTRPSYLLRTGRGRHIQHEVRRRLALLLRKLMRQHNWAEASGVLSVLLQGTCLDHFDPVLGRLKYSASMELLKNIKDDDIDLRKLQSTYDIWIGRMSRTRSSVRIEDKVALHLEYILFTLNCGSMGELYQATLSLMKERGVFSHPIPSLVIGLSFYVLWYDGLSQELKMKDSDEVYASNESDDRGARFGELIEYSECSYAACTHEAVGSTQYDSETSVMNDKRICMDMKLNEVVLAQNEPDPEHRFHTEGFYSKDQQISSENEASVYDDGNYIFDPSTFSALGCVESWLVPLRLPHTNDEFTHMQQRVLNHNYKEALKYFRLALCATPPVSAALLPLIQLLLVVGRVAEALRELDKFCEYSNAPIPLRIKASLYECLCSNDPILVQTCFEDVLKKDPTCQQSLARLVNMYQNGAYSPVSLVEMIALHLDATYAESDSWKELASCFLALSHYEVDQMSVLEEGNKEQTPRSSSSSTLRKTPKLFAEGVSGKGWRLRCRWWARRHFSKSTYKSEASAGVMELVCYKAACASHMYGKEMEYVGKAYSYLEEENRKDLINFLQIHMENSVRIIASVGISNIKGSIENIHDSV